MVIYFFENGSTKTILYDLFDTRAAKLTGVSTSSVKFQDLTKKLKRGAIYFLVFLQKFISCYGRYKILTLAVTFFYVLHHFFNWKENARIQI